MLRDLVLKNRSYRRFKENQHISFEALKELVDLARLTPSAANLQPLRYVLSNTPDRNAAIFPTLAWAGYLKDWPGPAEGERPAAYIVLVGDLRARAQGGCDHGIAAQTILLGAVEKGLGGCMIGSIRRDELMMSLGLDPEHYEILLVLAMGIPAETVVLEDVDESGSIRYYRDANDVHHVPKRKLEDVILG